MFKKSTLFLIFFSPVIAFAQITFEKGYFIDNDGKKTECLIKNLDWKNNPTHFEYKASNESESKVSTISSVQEFGVDNFSKYVRAVVKIDRSSDSYDSLSNERRPIWSEEQVFLRVLVGGKASLYTYQDGNLTRFFYGVDGLPVQQLVYKKYLSTSDNVAVNSDFRQQLWMDVKCGLESQSSVKNISYTASDLVRFFSKYSECNGEKTLDFVAKKNTNLFNLKIKPGLDLASLDIIEPLINGQTGTISFASQTNFRFGLEAEYVLPYNNNKWAIVIEPTLQYVSGTSKSSGLHGEANFSYSCLEMPIGARHYIFLNKDTKIFLNGFIVPDYPMGSKVNFADGFYIEYHPVFCFAFGAGLSNRRLSAEVRYYTPRNMLAIQGWGCNYSKVSLILGFRIF